MDGGSKIAVSCSITKESVKHTTESDTSEKDNKPMTDIEPCPPMLVQLAARVQSMLIDLHSSRIQLAEDM